MSRKSEKGKKLLKYNNNQEKEQTDIQNDSAAETSLDTEEIRTIIVSVNNFSDILPLYPVSDIKAKFKFLDKEIGETSSIPITDDEKLVLNEHIEIPIDINSVKQVDQLASYPIFLTALQLTGSQDPTLYEYMRKTVPPQPHEEVDSLFSMYEVFTGEQSKVKIAELRRTKKKGKKEISKNETEDNIKPSRSTSLTSKDSKSSKKSKSSVPSAGKIKDLSNSIVTNIKSEIYGMCVIDLIPLFYGENSFTEQLILQPIKKTCHILSTYKNSPKVTVTVSIKEDLPILNDVKNILNFTVESICNVPTLMTTDMDCKICILLPLLNLGSNPTIFHDPKITAQAPVQEVPKRWPGIHDIGYNTNTTKFLIESSFDTVKNKSNLNILEGFEEGATRLEFNYLKRNILLKCGNNDLAAHIVTHRKLVLELYLTPKTRKSGKFDVFPDDPDSSPKLKLSKSPPFLHLMAILDVSALLYPGMTRIRIAAPISTFSYEETAKVGLVDSYFLPLQVETSISKAKIILGQKKKQEKKEKVPKKDKASTVKEERNLAILLPSKPEDLPAPEPSVPVYNEETKLCFIIVEIELLKPINAKRDLEELKADMQEIQMDAVTSRKTILNKHVAADFYKQTINEIIDDLNNNYLKYYETKTSLPSKDYGDFLAYLQKVGSYKNYLHSITTAATYVVTQKYKCAEQDFRNSKNYQNLISEVFTDLISEMHSILNSSISTGMQPTLTKLNISGVDSYFYAKEATELRLFLLADRYFMEMIIYDQENNSDYWFYYAVFNIEIGDTDKAFECLKEAIAQKCDHKYSVLLFGALLTQKGKMQEAETCFLNLMVQQPKWLEGWCMLYLYYQKYNREDGMDMAYDMAKKLIDDYHDTTDYFVTSENLAWSAKNIPDTIFFQTAILLIKIRLYSWAELALAHEVTTPKYYGYVNYLLAVISYYQKNYDHALQHIEEAKDFHGKYKASIFALPEYLR